MLIKTNYNKVIGFFVPSNFKAKSSSYNENPLLAFYWINQNSQLVTSSRRNKPIYETDKTKLISLLFVLDISLDRRFDDYSKLWASDNWVVK